MGYLLTTTVAVAAVEEAVDPIGLEAKESEFSFKHLMKVLGFGESASWPIGRDVMNYAIRGGKMSAGIYTTAYDKIGAFINDLKKDNVGMDPDHAAKTIRDLNFVVGLATGMSNEELGKVGQYVIDHTYGKAKAKGPGDIYRALKGEGATSPQVENWQTRLLRQRR